jgi:2-iminobutanoate/2-iminopropanoate deaminase
MNRAVATVGVFLVGMAAGAGSFAAKAAPVRKHINLPGRAALPFSDAVLVGDTLYLAGRLGLDPATGKPPADPAREARLLLDGFAPVLAEAGMAMDDLVSVQVFCSDVSLFDTWNRVYPAYFGKELPARAFIGSGPLLFGARFEMQAIAVRR